MTDNELSELMANSKDLEDGEVLGLDEDGFVICFNAGVDESYNCGETLEEFGIHNLRENEVIRLKKQDDTLPL